MRLGKDEWLGIAIGSCCCCCFATMDDVCLCRVGMVIEDAVEIISAMVVVGDIIVKGFVFVVDGSEYYETISCEVPTLDFGMRGHTNRGQFNPDFNRLYKYRDRVGAIWLTQ